MNGYKRILYQAQRELERCQSLMDESDIWFWYEYLPTLNDWGEWYAQGRIRRVKYDDVDHENSLERRP